MTTKVSKEVESLLIHLGTPTSEANASAVASAMHAITTLIQVANDQFTSERQLTIKTRPFAKGSLEIPLDLILPTVQLAFDNVSVIAEILAAIKSYVDIRKVLRGRRLPKPDVNNGVIVDGDARVSNSVVNIFNNSDVTLAFNRAAADVQADAEVKKLAILRESDRSLVAEIDRTELDYFSEDVEATSEEGQSRVRSSRKTVIVRAPDLEGKAKWKLILDGRSIAADVKDEGFIQRVRKGAEEFAAGDRLDCDVELSQRYNQALDAFQTKAYRILRVYKHIKKGGTRKLNLRD